jgi:hypothetical protein
MRSLWIYAPRDFVAAKNAGAHSPILNAARSGALAALCAAVLALGLILALPAAQAQPSLTASQSDALNRYNKALSDFKSILRQRRAQIDEKQKLPNLPGQALYLARNAVMISLIEWKKCARPTGTACAFASVALRMSPIGTCAFWT